MRTWEFERGHTELRFRTRHMMVSWVNGMFKNISGTVEFDTETGEFQSMETEFDAKSLWTGLEMRDNHLRSADFLDVENHPKITFKSTKIVRDGKTKLGFGGRHKWGDKTKLGFGDVAYSGEGCKYNKDII